MSETKIYKIHKMKQLIDLNDDLINFEVFFNIKSINNTPFKMSIVNQYTLDNQEIQYKNVNDGFISGNVKVETNKVFQNYYIVLKSDESTDCEVTIERNELKYNKPKPKPKAIKNTTKTTKNINPNINCTVPPKRTLFEKIKNNWKIILLVIIVLLIIYNFSGNSEDKKIMNNNDSEIAVTELLEKMNNRTVSSDSNDSNLSSDSIVSNDSNVSDNDPLDNFF